MARNGRRWPIRPRTLYVCLQYIEDIQRLMLKVVFRVVSRPLGKSYIGLTLDFFRFPTSPTNHHQHTQLPYILTTIQYPPPRWIP